MADHATDHPLPAKSVKTPSFPRVNLVVCNIQKIANVKAMLLASVAFGCTEVLVVGMEKNLKRRDAFPPPFCKALEQDRIALRRFAKWKECVAYMQERGMVLVGVEIDETSQLLNDDYFARNFPHDNDNDNTNNNTNYNIGILMGNEGQGIQPAHLKNCHGLIRIPQHGAGTASMNVNVATNIVLYRFQKWKRQLRVAARAANR